MNKTARIFLTLLLVFCLLPACTRKQAPTQLGNATGGNSDLDLIPLGNGDGDWGLDDTLEARGDGIGNGKYDDFTMVEGVLPSVYFGFDSSSIAAPERGKLQQAADYLEQNPDDHILIEGHSDWYGTSEYNLALGDRRAASAGDYLGSLGISPLRIEKLSKGSLESVSGLSKSESSQDRRVDLILPKK